MVLVVEDDDDLLEVLGLLFEHAGVAHAGARSLAEVQALGDRIAELTAVVIDINLGGGQPTGLDVAAWLRAHGFRGRVSFMTGHAPDHALVRAAVSDDGEVLEKPIDTRALLRIARADM